jgi:hypothetical protein
MAWKISALLSLLSKIFAGIGGAFVVVPNLQVVGAIFLAISAGITAFEKVLEEQGIVEAAKAKAKKK